MSTSIATSRLRDPPDALTCMSAALQPCRPVPQLSERAAMAGFRVDRRIPCRPATSQRKWDSTKYLGHRTLKMVKRYTGKVIVIRDYDAVSPVNAVCDVQPPLSLR